MKFSAQVAPRTKPPTCGVTPIVLDVFDASALSRSMAAVRPEIVIHQLTDLPAGLEPSAMAEGVGRTTRIRIEGTKNLVAAALQSGARRFIAQSLACWVYAEGPRPYSEKDPLDLRADAPYALADKCQYLSVMWMPTPGCQ